MNHFLDVSNGMPAAENPAQLSSRHEVILSPLVSYYMLTLWFQMTVSLQRNYRSLRYKPWKASLRLILTTCHLQCQLTYAHISIRVAEFDSISHSDLRCSPKFSAVTS